MSANDTREVTFRIRQPRERLRCPQCQCDEVWIRGHEERTFRMVPIGGKPTFLTLDVARVRCPACDTVRQVRRARVKVKAVATDMSAAYIRAVRDNLPRAVHVCDHFHVIKLFNDKLSALRRQLRLAFPRASGRFLAAVKITSWRSSARGSGLPCGGIRPISSCSSTRSHRRTAGASWVSGRRSCNATLPLGLSGPWQERQCAFRKGATAEP